MSEEKGSGPAHTSRTSLRVEKSVPMKYRTLFSRGWQPSHSNDISAGGLSFTVKGGVWIRGMSVDLQIDLPFLSLISARGTVTRVRHRPEGREVAVKFTRLSKEDESVLGRYALWRHKEEARKSQA